MTLESGDGGGKTTQIELLEKRFCRDNFNVIVRREPGGTDFGELVRELLLHNPIERCELSNLFQFESCRAALYDETILPTLKSGGLVINSRSFDASTTYQGYAGGIDLEIINTLNKIATFGKNPDLTIIIDVPVEEGLGKAIKSTGRYDRYEAKKFEFHEKVRQGYLKIAHDNPKRCVIIDYIPEGINEMHEQIYKITKQRIDEKISQN